ncbi:MAG: ABC transporter ATP-binding protein [Gammaproteobacteria bacterium]
MISLKQIDFLYPGSDFRLQVPKLDISSGECVALIGASGSGKTTLLELIAGIHQPRSGQVTVADTELASLPDSARREFRLSQIGLVFQAFELLEYLTVRENLLLPYRLSSLVPMPADRATRLGNLANAMGIANRLQRYPEQLSQGERQRAAICRALVTLPQLILADEPTGNLDPDNKQRVLDLLLEQVRIRQATLVMVTHDQDLLAPFDRIIDMREFGQGAVE